MPISSSPPEDTTRDDPLPFGWVTQHEDFTAPLQADMNYFRRYWIASLKQPPKVQYGALKSFVIFLEDAQKLCYQKGKDYAFWYDEILTSKGYLETRKKELQDLEENMQQLQKEWLEKEKKEAWIKSQIPILTPKVIQTLKENDGILQSEFWKLFDPSLKEPVVEILCALWKDGKVERTKSGRSYILHVTSKL